MVERLPLLWAVLLIGSESYRKRKDLESAGLRRLVIYATYWGMRLESSISPTSSVDYVGPYKPLASGFNYEKLGVVPKFPAAYK